MPYQNHITEPRSVLHKQRRLESQARRQLAAHGMESGSCSLKYRYNDIRLFVANRDGYYSHAYGSKQWWPQPRRQSRSRRWRQLGSTVPRCRHVSVSLDAQTTASERTHRGERIGYRLRNGKMTGESGGGGAYCTDAISGRSGRTSGIEGSRETTETGGQSELRGEHTADAAVNKMKG